MEDRLQALEKKVERLDRSQVILETELRHMAAQLERISASLSRLVWIVLTGLIGAMMAWIVKGGASL